MVAESDDELASPKIRSRVKAHPSLQLGDPIDRWGLSTGLRGAEYLDDEDHENQAITRKFRDFILDTGVVTGLYIVLVGLGFVYLGEGTQYIGLVALIGFSSLQLIALSYGYIYAHSGLNRSICLCALMGVWQIKASFIVMHVGVASGFLSATIIPLAPLLHTEFVDAAGQMVLCTVALLGLIGITSALYLYGVLLPLQNPLFDLIYSTLNTGCLLYTTSSSGWIYFENLDALSRLRRALKLR